MNIRSVLRKSTFTLAILCKDWTSLDGLCFWNCEKGCALSLRMNDSGGEPGPNRISSKRTLEYCLLQDDTTTSSLVVSSHRDPKLVASETWSTHLLRLQPPPPSACLLVMQDQFDRLAEPCEQGSFITSIVRRHAREFMYLNIAIRPSPLNSTRVETGFVQHSKW